MDPGEGGCTRLGNGLFIQPAHDASDVHGRRREDVLQVGFGQADVAGASEASNPDGL